MKRENVTIYCASSPMIDNCFFEAATQLSTLLAQRNIGIVYGAGRVGLMGCVADCALKLGGKVTGVIPQFMVNRDWCHKSLSHLVITQDMHERKQTMAQMGDAAIALPGGCGTLEEPATTIPCCRCYKTLLNTTLCAIYTPRCGM